MAGKEALQLYEKLTSALLDSESAGNQIGNTLMTVIALLETDDSRLSAKCDFREVLEFTSGAKEVFIKLYAESLIVLMASRLSPKRENEITQTYNHLYNQVFLSCSSLHLFGALIRLMKIKDFEFQLEDLAMQRVCLERCVKILNIVLNGADGIQKIADYLKALSAPDAIEDTTYVFSACQFLTSIPDRCANISGPSDFDSFPNLKKDTYYGTLARSIVLNEKVISETIISRILSIMSKIVMLKKTLCVWIEVGDLTTVENLVKKTPVSALEKVISALVGLADIVKPQEYIAQLLQCLLLNGEIACALYTKCLSRQSLSQTANKLLVVVLIRDNKIALNAMNRMIDMWSNSNFISRLNVELHLQISRTILLFLNLIKWTDIEINVIADIKLKLMQGVQLHIGLSDPQQRLFGMVVAEGFSRFLSSPEVLKFDIDVESFDISFRNSVKELLFLCRLEEDATRYGNKEQLPQETIIENVQISYEDLEEDDLIEYDMSAEASSEDSVSIVYYEKLLRKSISAPNSIPRILKMLQDCVYKNKDTSIDPETVQAALYVLSQVVSKPGDNGGISYYSANLFRTCMALSPDNFPDENATKILEAKRQVLEELGKSEPLQIGTILIRDYVYSKNTTLLQRSEALSQLSTIARNVCGRFELTSTDRRDDTIDDIEKQNVPKLAGTTTKYLERSLENLKLKKSIRPLENRLAPIVNRLFGVLYQGMEQIREPWLQLESRDSIILAQIIATLSVLISCAGPQYHRRPELCRYLLESVWRWRFHSDLNVRRSCGIALGSICECLSGWQLLEELVHLENSSDSLRLPPYSASGGGGGGDGSSMLLNYLEDRISHDPDVKMRLICRSVAASISQKLIESGILVRDVQSGLAGPPVQ